MLIRITLAVQEAALRKRLQAVLTRPDVLVNVPRVRKDLWQRIVQESSDVLIVGESLLPEPPATALAELQNQPDSPGVVVLSESDDPKAHARLMAKGFDAALAKGLAVEQIRDVVEALLKKRQRLTQRLFSVTQPLAEPRLADFASSSPGMQEFMKVVPRVVPSDTTLLIQGETGVGKERLACAIHAEGPRAASRFVALNCGALPEHLLESELFGHVRGAFTGATTTRRGWFEVAHQGTLFLDEIGEIPLHLQVKLLRALQEQVIQPLGSEKSIAVDVRVIAASNRSLPREVEAKRFREDLYYRLSVVTVTVPPLRERQEDIPTLVERHISYLSRQLRRPVTGIHAHAMQALCRYSWPGNVRELNNVLERAILLCDDTQISLDDLPEPFVAVVAEQLTGLRAPASGATLPPNQGVAEGVDTPVATAAGSPPQLRLPLQWLERPLQELRDACLANLERQYIEGVLAATRGRIGEAAKRAGLSDRSLYEKMQQFGLRKENFRQGRGAHTGRERRKHPPHLDRRTANRV